MNFHSTRFPTTLQKSITVSTFAPAKNTWTAGTTQAIQVALLPLSRLSSIHHPSTEKEIHLHPFFSIIFLVLHYPIWFLAASYVHCAIPSFLSYFYLSCRRKSQEKSLVPRELKPAILRCSFHQTAVVQKSFPNTCGHHTRNGYLAYSHLFRHPFRRVCQPFLERRVHLWQLYQHVTFGRSLQVVNTNASYGKQTWTNHTCAATNDNTAFKTLLGTSCPTPMSMLNEIVQFTYLSKTPFRDSPAVLNFHSIKTRRRPFRRVL